MGEAALSDVPWPDYDHTQNKVVLLAAQTGVLLRTRHPFSVTGQDETLAVNFHQALDDEDFAECPRCRPRWFDMTRSARPRHPHQLPRSRRPQEARGFQSLDRGQQPRFGQVPAHMPKLSQLEEMLSARVHVYVVVKKLSASGLFLGLMQPLSPSQTLMVSSRDSHVLNSVLDAEHCSTHSGSSDTNGTLPGENQPLLAWREFSRCQTSQCWMYARWAS